MTAVAAKKDQTFHSYEQLERELMPKRAAERDGPPDPGKRIVDTVVDAIRSALPARSERRPESGPSASAG